MYRVNITSYSISLTTFTFFSSLAYFLHFQVLWVDDYYKWLAFHCNWASTTEGLVAVGPKVYWQDCRSPIESRSTQKPWKHHFAINGTSSTRLQSRVWTERIKRTSWDLGSYFFGALVGVEHFFKKFWRTRPRIPSHRHRRKKTGNTSKPVFRRQITMSHSGLLWKPTALARNPVLMKRRTKTTQTTTESSHGRHDHKHPN